MHVLVPTFILNQVQQGNQYGELQAVGLFVDLTGFSTMTDTLMQLGQHGAEIMATIMRQIFTPMIEQVYRHRGFIATFAGDSFTAIFPLDTVGESGSPHPISAAVEILQEISSLQPPQTPVGTFSIAARVGIAAGTARWGIITSQDEERAAYYFRGSAIEGCIKAQSLAQNGEIVLDETTKNLFQSFLQVQPVEEHFLLTATTGHLPEAEPLTDTHFDLKIGKRFYPESILTRNLMGEFRHAVNMFISLPTVRTEPQLEIFLQTLFTLQNRYGGLLNRIDFGDKGAHLMLFWGAPVAYENDIGRALNFILSLQAETSIPINAGVTYQIAHAGFIGSDLREEYTCYGRGVNLAARFMTKAPRGEVWLDENIAKRMQRYFEIEYEGEFSFKGFEEKQKVFALFERRESAKNFFEGQFVGRTDELERLASYFHPMEDNKAPKPVVLAGEPGIGKSRIAYQFLFNDPLADHEILIAICQTNQMLREAFNPFRYWAKNYFEVQDSNSEARNKRNFNRRLDKLITHTTEPTLAAELDRTRSFLGSLVNLYWDDSLYEQLDPQGRYENTIIGLTTLLLAESLLQPVVLLIEDLQWIDSDSKVFLQQLYRSSHTGENASFPIFLLGTSRNPEPENSLGEGIPYELITLPPLTETLIHQMAASLLDGSEISQQFAATLVNFSEGNPLYTEQIIRYLQEENYLVETENGWGLIEEDVAILPSDTRALLVARLDQFAAPVKQVILTAATLGREFNTLLLAHMMPEPELLEDQLYQGEQAAVWTPVSNLNYIFKSNLLRDTAYRMQTHAQRHQRHELAVEALENPHVRQVEISQISPELAFHAENAGLKEKARRYYRIAGETAHQSYHNQQAVYYFTKALDISREMGIDTFMGQVLISRQNTYNLTGLRDSQREDIELAEKIATQFNDQILFAKTYNAWSRYYHLVGEYETSIQFAQKAIEITRTLQQPEIEAESRNLWGISSLHTGDYPTAIIQATKSLEIGQQNDDIKRVGASLNILSLTRIAQGKYIQAIETLNQGLETARSLNNFAIEAQTLNNLGNLYGEMGDYSSAYEAYTQAQALAQKIGSRMGEGFTTANLGWIAGILGNYTVAKTHLEKSIRISQELGDQYVRAFTLLNLSLFTSPEDEGDLAKSYAQEGLAILKGIGHKPGEAVALTFLGHALTTLGQYEEAQRAYQEALNIRIDLGQENLSMESLAGLAEVQRITKGAHSAAPQVTEILKFLENGGSLDGIDQPFRIYIVCAKVLLENDRSAGEKLILKAYTLLQKSASKIKDEEARKSYLTNVPCHRDLTDLYLGISHKEPQTERESK